VADKIYANLGRRLSHLGGRLRSDEELTAVGDYAAVNSQFRMWTC
jgi:hypothetical protein